MACLGMFGLAWVVGYAICRAVLGRHWPDLPTTLRLGLGWAAGAAFSGMTTFWAIALAPNHRGLFVGVAAAVALALSLLRSTKRPDEPATTPQPRSLWDRVAWWTGAVVFVAVVTIWLGHGIDVGVNAPAGGWDAFSIWNLRARFFYLCPEEWTRGFDPAFRWSHPEYPALHPSLVVYGWLPEGRCVAAAPVAVALLTHVSLLLLIVGLTQAAYPRSAWPWAFGIFYATIPQEWTQEGAWQYADRPVGVFLLAAVGCLALALRQKRPNWLLLAGFFWGAAAFCKDEGKAALVILALGIANLTVCALVHCGGWRAVGRAALLSVGLIPGVASLALQRHFSPISSELLALMSVAPLTDSSRTDVILQCLQRDLNDPKTGWMWWGCGLVLATLAPWMRRRELWLLWVVPAAQLLVYLVIFQLTPMPLEWHVDSALFRLLMHIGPIFFVAASWLILEAKEATGL